MPFDFLRRRRRGANQPPAQAPSAAGRHGTRAFEALTEEWRLSGWMDVTGRLSDVLNERGPIPISDVRWAPLDETSGTTDAPGLRSVDPYDLIVVIAGESTQPPLTDAERAAHKVHKITYDVALEAPPFRILGTVQMYPGSEPTRLLDRSTEMFVAVIEAVAWLGKRAVTNPEGETMLVNRFYLRGVEQIDKRTGERPQKLLGRPIGGTSWQERT